ncbi:MAG: group II intron reverse transcriptase/maturase [Calothrix sp. MO_192.B10]|nr:group II intron reverse transcriptase/maturase [Calothrix sp. MO_192.B10]
MKVNYQSTNKNLEVSVRDQWKNIPWRKLERKVYKLQRRIYRASQRGETLKVRKLQRLLMKSRAAKLLAIRRVTQENKGKKTAGIDGVKSLTPYQRLKLAKNLRINGKAKPTRRVWIPKPGKEEKRPLGIPVMEDRAKQKLVQLVLDPEWEARFEPNSYGFRKGRSCHDAIDAINSSIQKMPKWVLDADIASCFDRINHQALLNKLNTNPNIRRQIKAWLQSGVMDGIKYHDTTEGTPQGGTISPLLANVALHGLENRISQAFSGGYFISPQGKRKRYSSNTVRLIRYADDFVLLHEDLNTILITRNIVSEWLHDMGLELKPSKTKITHTLNGGKEYETGFDFLGFHIQQFEVGKHQSRTKDKIKRIGFNFNTIITPSKQKIQAHLEKIHHMILVGKAKVLPQVKLIANLNPVIRGWANYYKTVNSSVIFHKLDHLMYLKLRRWTKRRHSNKSKTWIASRYWGIHDGKGWEFIDKRTGITLEKYSNTKLRSPGTKDEYVKVKGKKSPYDGDIAYWAARTGEHPELPKRKSLLLKQQKQRCTYCGLFITDALDTEVHHKDGNHKNDKWENLELIHMVCHDLMHANKTNKKNHADGTKRQDKSYGVSIDKFPFYI